MEEGALPSPATNNTALFCCLIEQLEGSFCPVSSGVEQVPYKDKVEGAKPSLGTNKQSRIRKVWLNPPALGAGDRRFESFIRDQLSPFSTVVVQMLCKHKVGSSNLSEGTITIPS